MGLLFNASRKFLLLLSSCLVKWLYLNLSAHRTIQRLSMVSLVGLLVSEELERV
jgi:hypothetical protein